MGLVRSFIKASDTGEYITSEDPKEENLWVNSGISTVVPAWEIAEIINQEELERMREKSLEHWRESNRDTPVSIPGTKKAVATEPADANPDHKEDFTSLLNAAAKEKPQAD